GPLTLRRSMPGFEPALWKVPTKSEGQPSPSTSPQAAPCPRMPPRAGNAPDSSPTSRKTKGYSPQAGAAHARAASSPAHRIINARRTVLSLVMFPRWRVGLVRPFGLRDVNDRQRDAVPRLAAAPADVPGDEQLVPLRVEGEAVRALH